MAGRYINIEKLKRAEKGPIKIYCYNNVPDLQPDIHKAYKMGYQLSYKEYMVTNAFLMDKTNFNS